MTVTTTRLALALRPLQPSVESQCHFLHQCGSFPGTFPSSTRGPMTPSQKRVLGKQRGRNQERAFLAHITSRTIHNSHTAPPKKQTVAQHRTSAATALLVPRTSQLTARRRRCRVAHLHTTMFQARLPTAPRCTAAHLSSHFGQYHKKTHRLKLTRQIKPTPPVAGSRNHKTGLLTVGLALLPSGKLHPLAERLPAPSSL